MAKELPYFRFFVSEWLNGNINLEGYMLKGVFIDVCSYYWFKDCSVTRVELEKRFKNARKYLLQLIELDIIKIIDIEFIQIDFLDEQHKILSGTLSRRQKAGSIGGKKKAGNTKAKLKHNSSYKDKDKDNYKDKDKIEIPFSEFWNTYNYKIGNKTKTENYWTGKTKLENGSKINNTDRQLIIKKIPEYQNFCQSSEISFCNATTFLYQRRWENEFKIFKKRSPSADGGQDVNTVDHG